VDLLTGGHAERPLHGMSVSKAHQLEAAHQLYFSKQKPLDLSNTTKVQSYSFSEHDPWQSLILSLMVWRVEKRWNLSHLQMYSGEYHVQRCGPPEVPYTIITR